MTNDTYPKHKDDRTPEQMETHYYLIGGTDSFMSGWGHAQGKQSYAFWACKPEHRNKVERWVRSRGDIKRVREVASDYRARGDVLVHIYVVDDSHRAVTGDY